MPKYGKKRRGKKSTTIELNVKIDNSKPKNDYIDWTKELPVYNEKSLREEKPVDRNPKPKQNPKINGYTTKQEISTEHISSLQKKFNEFYNRTVKANSTYFGPQFIDLIGKLKENIDQLKYQPNFSNSFLQYYDNLKSTRCTAKKYIKKIDSAFGEAIKNKVVDPTSSSVNYKYGCALDFDCFLGGDTLKRDRKDLEYFISDVTEIKEKISNYHPITKEMENLSLAKSCELCWKDYMEKCREIKQSKENIENLVPNRAEKKENDKLLADIKADIENQTKEEKEKYELALEMLKKALESKKTTEPFEITKEDKDKLDKIFKSWNEKKKDLWKYDKISYQGAFAAKTKKGIHKGLDKIQKIRTLLGQFFGLHYDWEKLQSLITDHDKKKD